MKSLIFLSSLIFLTSCGGLPVPSEGPSSVDADSQILGSSISQVADTGSVIEQTLPGTLK